MQRKINYVCTVGPSTKDIKVLRKLNKLGMNMVRFNMSFDIPDLKNIMNSINKINQKKNINIKTIFDLAGTETRIIATQDIVFHKDDIIVIGQDFKIDQGDLSVLKVGDDLYIRDGELVIKVVKIENGLIYCQASGDGSIRNNNKLYNEKLYRNLPFISKKDERNIQQALESKADYIAISHTRDKKDIDQIKAAIDYENSNIKVISKIENLEATKNLDEIIAQSDGVMIARGDLGKILPDEELGYYQKVITEKALAAGKILMTATGYLLSMVDSPEPTRAEVIDLFSAFEDGIRNIVFTSEVVIAKDPIRTLKSANGIYKSYKKYQRKNKRLTK